MTPLIDVGEFVTCEQGHIVAEVVKPLDLGTLNYPECVGNWRIDAPVPGQMEPRCSCGARYWRPSPPSFHIKGRGWVPRTYATTETRLAAWHRMGPLVVCGFILAAMTALAVGCAIALW